MKFKHFILCGVLGWGSLNITAGNVYQPYTRNIEEISTRSGLFLDANYVFFSPTGRLENVIEKGVEGSKNNGNKSFKYVKGWKAVHDTIYWGVDVNTPGKLEVTPVLGVPNNQNGTEVEIILDGESKVIKVASSKGYENFKAQKKVAFNVKKAGRFLVGMRILKAKAETEVAYVKGLNLTGKATEGMEIVDLRWRPAAIHCSFTNHSNPKQVVLAVFEVKVMTPDKFSYFPITSPFGYLGSTWIPEKQQFGGINFSLWSFSAKAEPPETKKFSHLIAVGENLYIDGFNHEGTGSKAKGKNPYEQMHGTMQVLALKKIPGNPYDMYYSYYWDTNVQKWKLYGCGKKYNEKALTYLKTGAFVEVPGPPTTQRSNHELRNIYFRGWFKDEAGTWYPVDRMRPTGRLEKYSYKNWGKTDEYFFMEMGGLKPLLQKVPETQELDYANIRPVYLSEKSLADLDKLPATIEMMDEKNIGSDNAEVQFDIKELGTNAKVNLYWDTEDALTFVKGNVGGGGKLEWANTTALNVTHEGIVSYKLTNLKPGTTYYYRLQIKNDQGETWSFDTQKFTTAMK